MFSVKWVFHYGEMEPIEIEAFIQRDLDEIVAASIERLHRLRLRQVPRPPDGFIVVDAAGKEVRRWFDSPRSADPKNRFKVLHSEWDRAQTSIEQNKAPVLEGRVPPSLSALYYIVVPFVLAGEGKLAPGIPQHFQYVSDAKRIAAALGAVKAGVIVLQQRANPEGDVLNQPRMIWHLGKIPKEMFRLA